MNNKRAQFFIIGAIVIILIVLGFYGVKNVIRSSNNSEKIYDLKDELNVESASVVDYGLYSNNDTGALLDDFTDKYTSFAGQGKSLYFIFGDKDNIIVKGQEDVLTGNIGVQIGNSEPRIPIFQKNTFKGNYTSTDGQNITVIIKDAKYNFEIKPDQNFYFVVTQESGGGKQVVKN